MYKCCKQGNNYLRKIHLTALIPVFCQYWISTPLKSPRSILTRPGWFEPTRPEQVTKHRLRGCAGHRSAPGPAPHPACVLEPRSERSSRFPGPSPASPLSIPSHLWDDQCPGSLANTGPAFNYITAGRESLTSSFGETPLPPEPKSMGGGAAAPAGNCPTSVPMDSTGNSALLPLPGSCHAPSTGLITLINITLSTDLHIDPQPSFLMENSELGSRGERG